MFHAAWLTDALMTLYVQQKRRRRGNSSLNDAGMPQLHLCPWRRRTNAYYRVANYDQ